MSARACARPVPTCPSHEVGSPILYTPASGPSVARTPGRGDAMSGELAGYSDELYSDERVEQDLEDPDQAFLADDFDMFTLDATVIATALGQLLDEGRVDAQAKPYVRVAIRRQLHPKVVTSEHRKQILLATLKVLDVA